MSPLYHIVRFAKLSRQLDCGPLTHLFRRFADLNKDNRSSINAPRCSALPFLLSLILPGRRRTLNLQTKLPCGRCPRCALRCAPAVSAQLRTISCRSCMPCARCHASPRLSSPLVSAVSWLRPSRPRNMVTAS